MMVIIPAKLYYNYYITYNNLINKRFINLLYNSVD